MAQLIWALGAMAAERVFYGENSNGVGGDVQIGDRARGLHGRRVRHGARSRSTLNGTTFDDETEEQTRERHR